MRLLDVLRGGAGGSERYSLEEYAHQVSAFGFGGVGYPVGNLPGAAPEVLTSMKGESAEPIPDDFVGLVQGAYKANGIVFACMVARMLAFSSVRFTYQRINTGKPSELFGESSLTLLEQPWVGGTTQDLLTRLIQDADLAGNAYWTKRGNELIRLRPDWLYIMSAQRTVPGLRTDDNGVPLPAPLGWERLGYVYCEGGIHSGAEPVWLEANTVAHFAPIPDPDARFRGMSWLTPIIRQIQSDSLMTRHQIKYFEHAAPQPLDAGILTPTGWATMGDMRPGRRVIGSDGKPKEVLAVYPKGVQAVYRVTFADGAQTECTEDHLWTVTRSGGYGQPVQETLPLRDIAARLRYPSGNPRCWVGAVDPVEFDDPGPLPLDPYLVGSLLGDGHMGAATELACDRQDVDEQMGILGRLLPAGVHMIRDDSSRSPGSTRIRFRGEGRVNRLTSRLRELGLTGVTGVNKAVPGRYLRASVNERVALLQGLMDTDGSRTGKAGGRFNNTSRTLVEQVAELARGLGGRATVAAVDPRPGQASPQWVATISRLPEWIVPFRLSRKARGWEQARVLRTRRIVGVELVGQKPVQCIYVESEDHLYVTDDYVLTHNTPNMVIKHDASASLEKVRQFAEMMHDMHGGVDNAYRTLNLYPGADAQVVGANLEQISFKVTQGGGETRIAAAARVPPIIVGLSEGLQAATYSNYGQARRAFADGTCHPLWQNAAGSFAPLLSQDITRLSNGGTVRLWYDARDVPLLREDAMEAAQIGEIQARTIRTLVDGGYTPDSAARAVLSGDYGLLQHTGLFSVQLQAPGTVQPPATNGTNANAGGGAGA